MFEFIKFIKSVFSSMWWILSICRFFSFLESFFGFKILKIRSLPLLLFFRTQIISTLEFSCIFSISTTFFSDAFYSVTCFSFSWFSPPSLCSYLLLNFYLNLFSLVIYSFEMVVFDFSFFLEFSQLSCISTCLPISILSFYISDFRMFYIKRHI